MQAEGMQAEGMQAEGWQADKQTIQVWESRNTNPVSDDSLLFE